jgi:hypothetical protein
VSRTWTRSRGVQVASWQAAYRGGVISDAYLDGMDVAGRTARWHDRLAGGWSRCGPDRGPRKEEDTLRRRLVHICSFPEEESQMFRMTRIVPTTVLTVAALALAAPVAQAKPLITPSGGTTFANPSVQSTQDFNNYSTQRVHRDVGSVVVTTGDKPLANPVQLPTTTPVTVPDSSGNGFDWTAAAIGASGSGILMLMLAAGVGFRRRGQLAA